MGGVRLTSVVVVVLVALVSTAGSAAAGGLLIHDAGLLRWDANGILTIEAGPHQGFDGDPAALAALCAALT
jgi:hypothetical protein